MRRVIIYFLICVLSVSLLSLGISCKSEEVVEEAEAEEKQVEEAEEKEKQVEEAEEKEDLVIAVVPKAANAWFEVGIDGFKAACEEMGITHTYQSPDEQKGEIQAQLLENLIAQGVDGIAVAVTDPAPLTLVINEAMERGIPVITWNAGSMESDQIMAVETDNYSAGVLHGEAFVELLNGEPANFIITTPDLTGENLKQRVEGIRSVTKNYPELVELTTEQPYEQNVDTAVTLAQNLLTTYPEMDAYLDVAMYGAMGMVVVMKERNMQPGDLMQICWTNLPEIVEAVEEDYISGTLRQNPYAQGYLAAYGLKYYIEGKRPTVNKFDTGITLLSADNMLEIEEINKEKAHTTMKEEFDKLWQ